MSKTSKVGKTSKDKQAQQAEQIEATWKGYASPAHYIVSKVREAKGRNEKEKTLSEICYEHEWLQDVLYYTYSPFLQYFVAEKTFARMGLKAENQLLKQPLILDAENWRTVVKPMLERLSGRKLTGSAAKDEIELTMALFDTGDRDVLKCILLKDLRFGMAAKGINDALGMNLIHIPDTQLCNTYDPDRTYEVAHWYASRKMNGIRGKWLATDTGWKFMTRKDYPILGFEYLEHELELLCNMNNGIRLLDGELYSEELSFQTIASIVRGNKQITKEQKAQIRFNIFNIQCKGAWTDTHQMAAWMENMTDTPEWKDSCPHLRMVEYVKVINEPQYIEELCKEFVSEGYEGIVLRHPEVTWSAGRSDNLLKFKPFFECDLTVEETQLGTVGKKHEKSVAAIVCSGMVRARKTTQFGETVLKPVALDEKTSKDTVMLQVRVAASCSSLTDEERQVITQAGDDIVGMTAEIKFQSFTDAAGDDGYYSLNFATFEKFKGV